MCVCVCVCVCVHVFFYLSVYFLFVSVFGLSPEDIVKQLIPNISAPIDPTSLGI